jgi:hypothetical protein
LGVNIDKSVVQQLPKNVNTRRSGRIFHQIEELLIRLKLFGLLPIIRRLFNTYNHSEQPTWTILKPMIERGELPALWHVFNQHNLTAGL